ncbi:SDR family oxidoreductase [Streptomyces hainanensis]|uniref:SDR family oxidoreductase n=1 Tax=Streptomyces hainanensis TaxID=402648 RepID=UPI001A9D8C5A|nr:SDR family oxidoreductase [Streptomyces hainanensis]
MSPAALDPVDAASLPINALTAARLVDLLGSAGGRTLLVTGAAGPVGGYAVAPLKTNFFYDVENDKTIAWLKSMTINGDIGAPEDVVPVVQFLVSPGSRWVTGETIYVNGGMVSPAS